MTTTPMTTTMTGGCVPGQSACCVSAPPLAQPWLQMRIAVATAALPVPRTRQLARRREALSAPPLTTPAPLRGSTWRYEACVVRAAACALARTEVSAVSCEVTG